ncbi:MAG: proton-conducting transporter membrane subunit [Thermosphaera aggregans]|uniref:proton-conducting transporter transmembrane domain-containing protein n=1 Tax=Thermosphaera aggregans TaxID=54254 RepID=UPI003C0EAD5D
MELLHSSVGYGGVITASYASSMRLGNQALNAIIIAVSVFHTLTKALLFINTGLIYQIANMYDVYQPGYLYCMSREGALSACMALLNLTGIPPSTSFIVKVLLITTSILLASRVLFSFSDVENPYPAILRRTEVQLFENYSVIHQCSTIPKEDFTDKTLLPHSL